MFLVTTVALANQQAEIIGKMTSLKVAVYTGEMNVDLWGRRQWKNEFENNQVRKWTNRRFVECVIQMKIQWIYLIVIR